MTQTILIIRRSVAVDIYHISPGLPRFAFVAYTDPGSGLAAISDLNGQPINLDSAFARENEGELGAWSGWPGRLTAVLAEPPRLVPTSVSAEFPDLPDWALGSRDRRNDEAEKKEVDVHIKQQREGSPETLSRKRLRQLSNEEQNHSQVKHLLPHQRS